MLVGIAVGFIPGFHYIPIKPNIIFHLFLPPLLYDAAVNIPSHDFRINLRTISVMAITLVFISMLTIAVVSKLLIPDISWRIAFVIGAILSPPDVVAASGITKSLNLSNRTNTVLEGESLINDISVLTAYRIVLGVAVFILIGLEFPQVLVNIPSKSVMPLVICAFAIFFIALGTRTMVIFRHKQKLDKIVSNINNNEYKNKIFTKRAEY